MNWFISDTHYHHKNICEEASTWEGERRDCRNFASLQEMDDEIVYQINRNVKEDDTLYHLGDWSFGGIEQIEIFRKRINCKNIHYILGNHDHHIAKNKVYKENWIRFYNGPVAKWYEFQDEFSTEEECKKACTSFYQPEAMYYKLYDLFLSVNRMKVITSKINKKEILLCHYPFADFHGQNNPIHLHGHVHGRLPKIPGRLDVGIDNAFKMFGEYRPFSEIDVLTHIYE